MRELGKALAINNGLLNLNCLRVLGLEKKEILKFFCEFDFRKFQWQNADVKQQLAFAMVFFNHENVSEVVKDMAKYDESELSVVSQRLQPAHDLIDHALIPEEGVKVRSALTSSCPLPVYSSPSSISGRLRSSTAVGSNVGTNVVPITTISPSISKAGVTNTPAQRVIGF